MHILIEKACDFFGICSIQRIFTDRKSLRLFRNMFDSTHILIEKACDFSEYAYCAGTVVLPVAVRRVSPIWPPKSSTLIAQAGARPGIDNGDRGGDDQTGRLADR